MNKIKRIETSHGKIFYKISHSIRSHFFKRPLYDTKLKKVIVMNQ